MLPTNTLIASGQPLHEGGVWVEEWDGVGAAVGEWRVEGVAGGRSGRRSRAMGEWVSDRGVVGEW